MIIACSLPESYNGNNTSESVTFKNATSDIILPKSDIFSKTNSFLVMLDGTEIVLRGALMLRIKYSYNILLLRSRMLYVPT